MYFKVAKSQIRKQRITVSDVSIFVVPGCNCNNPDPDFHVQHNAANTNDQVNKLEAGFLEELEDSGLLEHN